MSTYSRGCFCFDDVLLFVVPSATEHPYRRSALPVYQHDRDGDRTDERHVECIIPGTSF